MSIPQLSCPKCNGEMVRGAAFSSPEISMNALTRWVEEEPNNNPWKIRVMPKDSIPISTFRCRTCGFLEAYAREEFEAK